MYRIKRVDGEDEEYAELLKGLHDEIFEGTAPQIDPERGWWWLASDGREIAGFCGLTPTYPQTDETWGTSSEPACDCRIVGRGYSAALYACEKHRHDGKDSVLSSPIPRTIRPQQTT